MCSRVALDADASAEALVLLFREVLGIPVGDLRKVLRSTSPTRLPAVLSRGEVRAVLGALVAVWPCGARRIDLTADRG